MKNSFGIQFKKWRKEAGVRQDEIEALLGNKSRGYCSQMEKGEIRPPTRELCYQLADHLKVVPREAVWHAAVENLIWRAFCEEPGVLEYIDKRSA